MVEARLGPGVTLWLDLLGPWVFLLLWLWCWQECAGGDWIQPAALNYEWISSTVIWDERPMAPVADVNLSSLAYCSKLHQEMKPRAGTTSYWCFLACRLVEVYVNYLRCSILQSSNQHNKVMSSNRNDKKPFKFVITKLWEKYSFCFESKQVPWEQCCTDPYQISKQSENMIPCLPNLERSYNKWHILMTLKWPSEHLQSVMTNVMSCLCIGWTFEWGWDKMVAIWQKSFKFIFVNETFCILIPFPLNIVSKRWRAIICANGDFHYLCICASLSLDDITHQCLNNTPTVKWQITHILFLLKNIFSFFVFQKDKGHLFPSFSHLILLVCWIMASV